MPVSAVSGLLAGAAVERLELKDMPHGFGNQGGWIPAYAQWLTGVFENN